MTDRTIDSGTSGAEPELEHHEYHSAVEVDETKDNWRDWVGPVLAVLFAIGAIVIVVMTWNGWL